MGLWTCVVMPSGGNKQHHQQSLQYRASVQGFDNFMYQEHVTVTLDFRCLMQIEALVMPVAWLYTSKTMPASCQYAARSVYGPEQIARAWQSAT